MKIIIFLLVFFGILLAMRWWSAHQRRAEDRAREAEKPNAKNAADGEPVVRCMKCGVHVPKSSAQMVPAGWTCTDSSCSAKP